LSDEPDVHPYLRQAQVELTWHTVGQAAYRIGVTVRELRAMGKRGTITVDRTPGGGRRVSGSEIRRVRQVLSETVTLLAQQIRDLPS
jgi:hypothetical protein